MKMIYHIADTAPEKESFPVVLRHDLSTHSIVSTFQDVLPLVWKLMILYCIVGDALIDILTVPHHLAAMKEMLYIEIIKGGVHNNVPSRELFGTNICMDGHLTRP